MAGSRPFDPPIYVLELDGHPVGRLRSVVGGGVTDAGQAAPITISCGAGAALAGLCDWLTAMLGQAPPPRRSGVIHTTNYDHFVISRLEFTNAVMTDVVFPTADAAGTDAATVAVTFAPEATTEHSGSGRIEPETAPPPWWWIVRDFRVEIPGIDGARVNRVDPPTVRWRPAEPPAGEVRADETQPLRMELSDVLVSTDVGQAQSFIDWRDAPSGGDALRDGTLSYVSEASAHTPLTLELRQLGVAALVTYPTDPGRLHARLSTTSLVVRPGPVTWT